MQAREAFVLRRYLEKSGQFKVVAVDTTHVGRDAFLRLQPSPISLQLVVQAMSGAVLLTSQLKDAGTLSLKFQGDGPMQHITVEANSQGQTRGYCGDIHCDFAPAEAGLFETAIGAGTLTYRWRSSRTNQIHTSVVPLVAGEMAPNLTHYLLQSDQIPSALSLGAVLDPDKGVKGSGGILIQALPGADPNVMVILEDRLANLPPLGSFFGQAPGFSGMEKILFENLDVELLHEQAVSYHCSCSRERILKILASLEENDISGGEEGVTVHCSFCTKPYHFSQDEIRLLNS